MPQLIKIEPKEEYLHVEVSGAFNHSKATEFIKNIMVASKHHDLVKILVHIRNIMGSISTIERLI